MVIVNTYVDPVGWDRPNPVAPSHLLDVSVPVATTRSLDAYAMEHLVMGAPAKRGRPI